MNNFVPPLLYKVNRRSGMVDKIVEIDDVERVNFTSKLQNKIMHECEKFDKIMPFNL